MEPAPFLFGGRLRPLRGNQALIAKPLSRLRSAGMPRRDRPHGVSPGGMKPKRHALAWRGKINGEHFAGTVVENFAERCTAVVQRHWCGGGHNHASHW